MLQVVVVREAALVLYLLLNPLYVRGREGSVALEKRISRTLARAAGMGITAVTVAHPWLVELAKERPHSHQRLRRDIFD